MLEKFGLTSKILCYVKDERTNLGIMTTTLKLVISWKAFNLLAPFDGACFGHAINKRTQYVINNDKVSKDLGHVTVKTTQASL
jgi:hypothetical protein